LPGFRFAADYASGILPQLMIAKIKRILLQQYIGAIVVAFIAAQGLQSLIGIVFSPIAFLLDRLLGLTKRNIFGSLEGPEHFAWTPLVPVFVNAVLYLLVAFLLIRWLFWDILGSQVRTEQNPTDSEQADESED
jgi:hypothetical protein